MDKLSKLFAKRLEAAIAAHGISKAELSRRSGTSRAQIDRYLDGTTEPGIDHADRLARALGTNLTGLLNEGAPQPDPKHAFDLLREVVLAWANRDYENRLLVELRAILREPPEGE